MNCCCAALDVCLLDLTVSKTKETIGASIHQVVQGNLRLEIEAGQLRSVDNLADNAAQLIEKTKAVVEVKAEDRLVGFL